MRLGVRGGGLMDTALVSAGAMGNYSLQTLTDFRLFCYIHRKKNKRQKLEIRLCS